MSVAVVGNTEEAMVEFLKEVIETRLKSRLDELTTAHGIDALPDFDVYFRDVIPKGASYTAALVISTPAAQSTLRNDADIVQHTVRLKVVLSGTQLGITDSWAMTRALGLYKAALEFIVQGNLRGGRAGVQTCLRQSANQPRPLVARDRAGHWGGTREFSFYVTQIQPII